MKKIFFITIILTSVPVFAQTSDKEIRSYLTNSSSKILHPKDLSVKQFINLFTEKYNSKSKLNFITLNGEFPKNWVKSTDIQYLLSIVNSKTKCCGYMNVFSSYISSDNAEVGGFALIFLKSYKTQIQINLGLNANPKADKKEVEKIKKLFY